MGTKISIIIKSHLNEASTESSLIKCNWMSTSTGLSPDVSTKVRLEFIKLLIQNHPNTNDTLEDDQLDAYWYTALDRINKHI